MASGYGAKGGVGRCFGIFSDLSYCMTQSKHLEDCQLFQEDYLECLHHQKEVFFFFHISSLKKQIQSLIVNVKQNKTLYSFFIFLIHILFYFYFIFILFLFYFIFYSLFFFIGD